MRNLIATCQLIAIVVIAVSVVHEVRNAEAGRNQRLQLLRSVIELDQNPPTTFCVLPPSLPTT